MKNKLKAQLWRPEKARDHHTDNQTGRNAKSADFTGAFAKISWSHQGLNLGPPDYESGALTN